MVSNKVLKIEDAKNGGVALRINDCRFVLDKTEQARLIIMFNQALTAVDDRPFPDIGYATYIVYDNGMVAVALSIAKLDMDAQQFIIFVTYMKPGTSEYKTDKFYLTDKVLRSFIEKLEAI